MMALGSLRFRELLFFVSSLFVVDLVIAQQAPSTNCSLNEFPCKTGECVDNLSLCDGIANCKDKSDETKEACENYDCPPSTYKCDYGGCVFGNVRCDGKTDCLDGSDENCNERPKVTIKTAKQNKNINYCHLPDHPANGFYYVDDNRNATHKFGDRVPDGTVLTFKCAHQHILLPKTNITCKDRKWSAKVPECLSFCQIPYRRHLRTQCYRDGVMVDCEPALNGTILKFACTRHHATGSIPQTFYSLCTNGTWDQTPYYCPDANGGAVGTPSWACPPGLVRCSAFGCVSGESWCDGKLDCSDSSDETASACKDVACPANKFRCAYGGCVQKDARCNGFKECVDNSDEDGCPPSDLPCTVPETPANGFVTVQGENEKEFKPGDEVSHGTTIRFRCKLGYDVAAESEYSYCLSGKWINDIPKCEKVCQTINVQPSDPIKVKCRRDENVVDCSRPFDGTSAEFKCSAFYEDPSLTYSPYRNCINGLWDRNLPNCIPECGLKFVNAEPLLIGGKVAKVDHWPWAVGIYRKENQMHICGGSLLNQKVVLSAAHCFCDTSDRRLTPDLFMIAGGKHFRPFNHESDKFAQYSDVRFIFMPNEYSGVDQNYRADIAVAVLKEPFVLNHNVRPVCIDWGPTFENTQYQNQKNGVVVGWGYTEEAGEPSNELKELDVPYTPMNKCTENISLHFKKFATTGDKICGGYLNQGTSACQGDSGGGYVFLHNDRYYIRGIVSVAPRTPTGNCDSNFYTLFTQVSKYNDFIYKYESLYRPH